MFMRIAVAVSIFVILLVSAWVINEQIKREYTTEFDGTDGFEIQSNIPPYMENNESTGIFPAFMSREYIRVDRRTK